MKNTNSLTRTRLTIFLRLSTILCSSVGVIICFINARFDGYSHWTKRLLYFTTQSNLWLVIVKIISLLTINKPNRTIYVADFIFTVNITLTGIIFTFLLAPFADESYHVWSVSGYLTHVFAPLFAIADFFCAQKIFRIKKKEIFYCLIPGLVYSILTCVLTFFNLDFGRGDNYPYFFYNYFSPAKIFGFSNIFPFYMGTFYWILLICSSMLVVGLAYAKISNRTTDKRENLLDRK